MGFRENILKSINPVNPDPAQMSVIINLVHPLYVTQKKIISE